MEAKKRSSFSGKLGFILTAASSAVGLGNLWRFPYLAAQYGGGTFLFTYIIMSLTFGFAVMITEVAIGRMTGLSAVGAFKKLDKRFAFCGWLGFLIPVIITPYYSVIGGWVLKYFQVYASGQDKAAAADTYFSNFTAETGQPIFWLFLFVLITVIIVFFGVQKGVEKAAVILMPILIALCIGVAVYTALQPHTGPGIAYYFKPDLKMINAKTILAALGQLFYSLSLAMGIMITFGSYMKKSDNLESSVLWIEVFDTLVAFLAGLIIVPSVFVFAGGDTSKMNVGAGLMFVTLPKVFESMPGGRLVGMAFFALTFFAAITSSISLMEAIVSMIIDKLHWKRAKASILVGIYLFLMGIPSSLGFGALSNIKPFGMDILDFFDFVSNTIMMPILAFGTCILAGFFIKPAAIIKEAEADGSTFIGKKFYSFIIRWIAPIGIVGILVSSILASVGVFSW